MYSLYDKLAQGFVFPRCYNNDAMAVRALTEAVSSPQSKISQYPDDYSLYKIGTFDDLQGCLTCLNVPVLIKHASDCVSVIKKLDENGHNDSLVGV